MDYLEILKQNDDPVHWKEEAGFDYRSSVQKVQKFYDNLSKVLRLHLRLETGDLLQDAIYHSEIFFPSKSAQETSLRFSNFGNLVTIMNPEHLTEEHLHLILDLFSDYGYVYVPLMVLSHNYTGINPGIDGFPDWFNRYFGC